MKSHTDLEQSKKLATILRLESADMHYKVMKSNDESNVSLIPYSSLGYYKNNDYQYCIPCWSLAALLGIIRKTIGYTIYGVCGVYISCELAEFEKIETNIYDNEVDACYEMIVKLHERKLI